MSPAGRVDTRGVLRIDDEDRVRLLTLDRPDALNAFNDDLYDAVRDALHDAAGDPGTAVVVVTGAGRAFTAGQDLSELASRRVHDDGEPHGFAPFIEALSTFPKPIVAAVNGVAVGIGLTMLTHCDVVLVAEGARLRAPFVSLGVTAEAASTVTLPALVGWQHAARLLFTSAWVEAEEAVEMGLAWGAVAGDRLHEEAMALGRQIAAMPVASLTATKRLLLGGRADAVRAALGREAQEFEQLRGGPANLEAIAAFRERRPPDFGSL